MHLQDDTLIAAIMDNVLWSEADAAHLAVCSECQARFVWWQETASTMDLARASTPSTDALARYTALFAQVQQAPSGLWSRVVEWAAALVWDSRTQPGFAGVRSVGATGYRLLYSAEAQEVELWVEPSNGTRVVEGEWMEGDGPQPGLLVELHAVDAPSDEMLTEAGEDGRFRLQGVKPGVYQMMFTPVCGAPMMIERLEIA